MTSQPNTPPTNDSEPLSDRALRMLERQAPHELTVRERIRLAEMRPEPTLDQALVLLIAMVEGIARQAPIPVRWVLLLRIRFMRRKLRRLQRHAALPATSTAQEHAADDHA